MQTEALQLLYIQKSTPYRHRIIYKLQQKATKRCIKHNIWSSKTYLLGLGMAGLIALSMDSISFSRSHVMYSSDNFCVKALFMKNKAHIGPWSTGQFIYICSPFRSFSCFVHAVVRAWKSIMSIFLFVFSHYFLFSCVSFGDGRKLCMTVDGDAWQVVSDDLINCKDKGERVI